MMDMVSEKDLTFGRYEELIVQRDQLRKDATSIEISYKQEFGDLITESFKAKIESIKLKKTIAKITQAVNRGEKVDMARIEKEIKHEMSAYSEQLKSMVMDVSMAKESTSSPAYVVEQVKRIYRRLAKKIHPDIYLGFETDDEAQGLWREIMIAYASNDLDAMQDLEVKVIRLMDDEIEKPKLTFSELEERIERLEREIDRILHTKPYIYAELLEDEEATKKRKQELSDELEEYRAYVKQLSNTLDELVKRSGVNLVWKMRS